MTALASLGELPELRPSDAVNLAEDRVACPNENVAPGDPHPPDCPACRGKGSISRPTGRDHLSFSAISTLLNCGARYGFAYEDRLEPVARSVPRALGTAYQKAIELGDPQAGVELLRESVEIRSQDDEDRTRVEEAIVLAASELYLTRWGRSETSEYEYRVRLRSPYTGAWSQTFDLLGYADGLDDKGAWLSLTENKLVGQINATSIRKLPLDRQLALSRYGIWRATGKAVREVRYRYMRKPSIKQKKGRAGKGAETLDQFCARIAADYKERPDFYALEEHLLVGEDDLVRIEAELWTWAEQLRRQRRDRIWPRNTSFCHEYGGCPFLAACLGDPDAASLYRVRPTRPVEALSLPE